MAPSPQFDHCKLVPINFANPAEFEELRRQRILCTWDFEDEVLERWRREMDSKVKGLFWITIPNPSLGTNSGASEAGELAQQSAEPPFVRAGHISLDTVNYEEDPGASNLDKSVMTFSTFFIDPRYRSLGIGRAAMDLLEIEARKEPYGSPNCKSMVVNALSRKYVEDDEWRKFYLTQLMGKIEPDDLPLPDKGRSNEDMYAKRGYVKWKVVPKYPVRKRDGSDYFLEAAYMRKVFD